MISYTSFTFFILYFGISFLAYATLPRKFKWISLLIVSYIFYFASANGHILPIIAASLIVWACGLWLQKLSNTAKEKRALASKDEKKLIKAQYLGYKRIALVVGILGTLGIFFICKYSNFFIGTANSLFNQDFEMLNIIQPLGISFYTLQAVSYLADVYHEKFPAEKNFFRISLFLSFMLTIVEGPIARYETMGPQLREGKPINNDSVIRGGIRVLWGLFKVLLIADRAAMIANGIFNNYAHLQGLPVIMGVIAYTVQLYFEFSGIMDIVCGLGEMISLKMPENFIRPFFAKTINEFWQRWHITLGTWLRDYIFYPISLSKGFKNFSKLTRQKLNPYYANLIPVAVALFFVWFCNGFWHGAGWKYVFYGLYYYILMMIGLFIEPLSKKLCAGLHIHRASKGYKLFQIIRTIIIVNIGMLIFRAESLSVAFQMFKSMFAKFSISSILPGNKYAIGMDFEDYFVLVIAFIIAVAVSVILEKGIDIRAKIMKLPYLVKFVLFMAMIFVVIIFGAYGKGYGVVDLIYANF